ncbi:thiamine-phosphate kinase [Thermogutta sp.]|uniref:thiamine-phosphate kinase n=1 Tax=Thermogutta sp. TaxID=1962930 RepID=UPI003C7BBA60
MEFELINFFRQRIPKYPCVRVGIGDDAAVIDLDLQQCVITTDVLMEGVDFISSQTSPEQIGRKALAVNLSDLAAMAASPKACVVGLVLPQKGGMELAKRLYEGLLPLARDFQIAVAGGDTNSWEGPLVISVTALGLPPPGGVLSRSGARPGDRIIVTGDFGGSILGKHLTFTPRVWEAIFLYRSYEVHAGIDVSDGLALDLWRLTQESQCGAVIHADSVPISEAAYRIVKQEKSKQKPLDRALYDGEDFELILAVPPAEAQRMLRDQPISVKLTDIGEFVSEKGLWLEKGKKRTALQPKGYEHILA